MEPQNWIYAFILIMSAIMLVGGFSLAWWAVRYGQKVKHLDWERYKKEIDERDKVISVLAGEKTAADASVEIARINAAAAVANAKNVAAANRNGRRLPPRVQDIERAATPLPNEEGE